MSIKLATEPVLLDHIENKEYSLSIDGVIELHCQINKKMFFDQLLDTVIEYVEHHNGLAGLAMSYKEYEEISDESF